MGTMVCCICGSQDVECRAWVKVNTEEITGLDDFKDSGCCYCCDCEENVILITEDEFNEKEDA